MKTIFFGNCLSTKHLEVLKNSFTRVCVFQIKLEFSSVGFGEEEKTGQLRRENHSEQRREPQQTQPTYSRARTILVGDKCSPSHPGLAPPTKQKAYLRHYRLMHVLCDNLIIHLDPHLTSTSYCRSTKFHKEKTVCMATPSNVDKLKFHCHISCIFNHQSQRVTSQLQIILTSEIFTSTQSSGFNRHMPC